MKRTVGNWLLDLMDKYRVSAKELALKSEVSATWISYIINGKRPLSEEVAEKIASALGVDPGLITGEAVSVMIKEQIEQKGMTLKEVAEKANVEIKWLENLDNFIPGEDDIVESNALDWGATIGGFRSYEWITRVAEVIGLPSAQLRAALARQEIPVYEGPQSTPEEDFTFRNERIKESQASYNIYTNNTKIPVLGSIPAGLAVEAVEDIIGWEEIPTTWLSGGSRTPFNPLKLAD